jgi:uncharacterized protein
MTRHTSYVPAVLLFIGLFFSGCAGTRTLLMQQVRTDMEASRFTKAYSFYRTKVKDTQDVDELLNLGLLAFEAGDYSGAQTALGNAERLAEERQTKSLSRESAGIALSDRFRAYQGTDMDKAIIHYYRALAFISQHQVSDAVIEGRRIASYLEVLSRDGTHTYRDDAYLQWFSGTLYDEFGQTNDAWISYKRSHDLYAKGFYGISEPGFLCPVTLGAAKRVGVEESIKEMETACPDTAAQQGADRGRVVVICEVGIAPPILETNLVFPIFTSDNTSFKDDEERDHYARELSHRHEGYGNDYGDQKLQYLLRVAMPVYGDTYLGTQAQGVSVRDSGSVNVHAELAEDLGAILRQDLKDRYTAITVRAITRALIKYAAKEAAEKLGKQSSEALGDILGAAVNIAGVASEAADTRSWETLPDRIFVADFTLPPGQHRLYADVTGLSGSTLMRHDFPEVDVQPGSITILRLRCVD